MEDRHDSNVSVPNIPVPDPSLLTTSQLRREIDGLLELIEEKLRSVIGAGAGDRQVLETRLDSMDKAVKLLQDTADRFPARIDEKIAALRLVHEERFDSLLGTHNERFNSIQTQFRERDVRSEQSSKDSKVAVDAALQAAKEAVGEQNKSSALAIAKSETATTKQIDGLGVQLQNMNKASDDKIADLKERLTRIEGAGAGKASTWVVVGMIASFALSLAVFFGLQGRAAAPPTPQVLYVPAPAPAPAPTPTPALNR